MNKTVTVAIFQLPLGILVRVPMTSDIPTIYVEYDPESSISSAENIHLSKLAFRRTMDARHSSIKIREK